MYLIEEMKPVVANTKRNSKINRFTKTMGFGAFVLRPSEQSKAYDSSCRRSFRRGQLFSPQKC